MELFDYRALITMQKISRTLSYADKIILTIYANYPQITLKNNKSAEAAINSAIQAEVDEFYRYASEDLYAQAIEFYKEAKENGFPFNPFDAILQYEVTYNQNCHLSMYRDQYQFTGGAHGITTRSSDTWNLQNGEHLDLCDFFQSEKSCRDILIAQILKQADARMQTDPGIFFEEYHSYIVQYFNENSYYLTPMGVSIYYQQYEIAPYAAGIIVFTIPYETLGWQPACFQ